MNEDLELLKNEGWILSESGLKTLDIKVASRKNITKILLDRDLREIGAGLTDLYKGKFENIEQEKVVLQILKLRNISAPKSNEMSKTAPKLLKLQLTDGQNTYSAIEMEPTALLLDTKPGTKICLKVKQLKYTNGQLLLTPKNMEILGGYVESLVSKWEISKSLTQMKGNRSGAAPPFIPFGQKIQQNLPSDRSFKSLQQNKHKDGEENSEFNAQRQDAIAEAAKAGTRKTFGGGNKTLVDSNVQKIMDKGYTEEQATTALKFAKNNVEKALSNLKRRDERQQRSNSHDYDTRAENSRDYNSRRGGKGAASSSDMSSTKPSTGVSLFDFLENKIPESTATTSNNANTAKQYAQNSSSTNNYNKSNNNTASSHHERFENNISSSFRKHDKENSNKSQQWSQYSSSNDHKSSQNSYHKNSRNDYNKIKMSTSEVWKHFTKISKDQAKCTVNKCHKVIKLVNYGTSGLQKHLRLHNIALEPRSSTETTAGSSQKQISMSSFVTRESRSKLLAECAAKDGFPVKAIANSNACKSYLQSRHHQMPSSPATIWKEIKMYHEEVINDFKQYILSCTASGKKFSIVIDEWTDISSKRYLNVMLHNGTRAKQFCLVSIGAGRCDSSRLKQLVTDCLMTFGLQIDRDIVGSTHDGASVMKKYGTMMPFETQVCLNHGINLAILDIIYVHEENMLDLVSADSDSDCDSDSDSDSESDTLIIEDSVPLEMNPSMHYVINKIRNYVRTFKRSPLKLAQFKKNVLLAFGKELDLILDCKTRWNSVLPMIQRFIQLKDVVRSTLAEFNIEYDDNIESKAQEMIEALTPVQESILKLGSDSCDLLLAEAICSYLLDSLEKLETEIGIKLFDAMKKRIQERRNIELISVLKFLHKGEYPKDSRHLKYSSKAVIKKKIKELYSRLFDDEGNEDIEDTESAELHLSSLEQTIQDFLSTKSSKKSIDSEIKAFEGTKERTEKLEKVFNALKILQATSTSVERSFSVAASFKTKIRNKLSPEKLNILVCLKNHFLVSTRAIESDK